VDKFSCIEDELRHRESRHQLRKLKTVTPLSAVEVLVNGRVMVNFSSNDYLGLSKHPLLRERAGEFMENYGTGATASRLISGSYDCFDTGRSTSHIIPVIVGDEGQTRALSTAHTRTHTEGLIEVFRREVNG
jgi:7-keto-8-aminopelargonate synthetase-like enzyme